MPTDPLALPWYDWLAVLASLITIAGIPFTIYRVLKTERTIKATEERLTRYQLLTTLPSLRQHERALDAAIQQGDRNAAVDLR